MNQILKSIKTPGSIRLALGIFLTFSLVIAAFFGQKLLSYDATDLDLDYPLAPPKIEWLKNWTVSEKGQNILDMNQKARKNNFKDSNDEDDEDEFDFLENDTPQNGVKQTEEIIHKHWLGTDKEGRDILALLMAGAKTAILSGLLTSLIALGFGIPMGLVAGYYGKWIAALLQGFNGVLLSFPRLVLILVVICVTKPNIYYAMIILGITLIPRVAEMMQTRVRKLSDSGFVLAAREAALSDSNILIKHILWFQCRSLIWVQWTLIMAESILIETTLSYLQFGTKPPDISWGNIIEGSQMTFFSELYWITAFPALCIIVSILGFFFLADGLNARQAHLEGRS